MATLQQTLNESLSFWQIEVTRVIYFSSGVFIYECVRQADGFLCVAKVIKAAVDTEKQEHEAKVLHQYQHPNLIRIYGYFWLLHEDVNHLVIMFEKREKDLWAELTLRKQSRNYWLEEQLWYYARCLIDVLAFLQEHEIAHRDIKPQNIFLISDGSVKIGEWGSSKDINEAIHTVIGTFYYMSPELRYALISQQMQVYHDPYKSDVFSLGLTLLTLAYLEPQTSLIDLTRMERCMEECISQLSYSEDFKNLLRGMLRVDPSQRCSFIDLRNWLGINSQVQRFESGYQVHSQPHAGEGEIPNNAEISVNVLEQHPSDQSAIPSEEVKEEIFLQQQVEEVEAVEPQPYKTVCLLKKCRKEIKSNERVVQLFCDSQHAFCSLECLTEFIEDSREKEKEIVPKCPLCHALVDPEVITLVRISTRVRPLGGQCNIQ